MDYLPPLAALRAFEVTARHASFSAAARELNVTHAAVSQQVRALEREIGLPLVVRAGRGLSLTDAGAQLARELTDGFGTIRAGVERLRQDTAELPVRITLTPTFASDWFMPRLATFRCDNPGVELSLNPSVDLVDLTAGTHDFAIRFGKGDWPGLEASLLMPTSVVVAAAPDMLTDWSTDRLEDLYDLPWFEEPSPEEQDSWLVAMGLDLKARRNVTELPGHMTLTALREGQGVVCVARMFVDDDIAAGRVAVLWEDDHPGRGYHIVHRPGPQRPAVVQTIRWLRRQAG